MSPAIIAVACALSTPASAGVEAIGPRGALTGFAITDGEGLVAEIQLGPGGAITARRATTRGGSLVLSGLDGGEAARFSRDSRVTVTTGDRWPRVEFDIGIEAFDEAAWQRAHGTVPFHYLLCETPGATFHYQGGGLIPAPEVDPFPISAKGFMAGNWADGWSYAPAMAGWAVPTVGMWNHVAGEFVAYDFSEARHTDRSSRLIAPAYCANEGGDPFFCLVHPYQRNWVELTCPETPTRAASHFELIYTRDLPDTADPNQFVLERLWNEKRDLLQPVPAMNDLAWIPEFDAGAPNGGLEPTAAGAQLRGFSSERGLEGIFVEPGTTMLGNTFVSDGIMRARSSGDEAQLARLREDVDYLLPRVKWVDIGGDRCATWVHPAEGTFKGQWGGEACAGNHHPSTFHIGTGLLLLHDITGDEALLPYIDGVYNWCKHYLYTRNGVCDLPWAEFCRAGTAAGESFLLNYRRVFRDDAERSRNHDEALKLARTSLYKVLWFYTADPDLTDDIDPTFLNQAVNDSRWIGRVTWNECGWVVRTMVPVYCETGDPFLKYLLRGALERYHAGFREDGGIAENLQISGEIEPLGARTGGFPTTVHGGNVRRWARPVEGATLRVAMGEKAAVAFCLNSRDYDVDEYRYAREADFSFRLVALAPSAEDEPIDIVATAPFRDLTGKTVRLNGEPIPAGRYEFNDATGGEDVYIHDVTPGDVIEIGDVTEMEVATHDSIPTRAQDLHANDSWECVKLGGTTLSDAWWQEDAWYGISPGRRHVWGLPISMAREGGIAAATGGTIPLTGGPSTVFAIFGRLRSDDPDPIVGALRVTCEGGEERILTVRDDLPIDLCNGFPLRQFDTYAGWLDLGDDLGASEISVEEGTLLALTVGQAGDPTVEAVKPRFATKRRARLAARSLTHYQAPSAACSYDRPWAAPGHPFRFRLNVLPTAAERNGVVVKACEDLSLLLDQVGVTDTVDIRSVVAYEVTGGQAKSAPAQFDPISPTTGELLIRVTGVTPAGAARAFDVYLGPDASAATPAVDTQISASRVEIDTGALQLGLSLSGDGLAPRWTHLAFGGENVLGDTGWHGGGGALTSCTDLVTWYDFGGLQETDAEAEIISEGPVATTIRVSGLEMWGTGDERVLFGNAERGEWRVGLVGEASLHFRFYANDPIVEQWVSYRVDRLDHGWTRAVQMRYGLSNPTGGANATTGGVRIARSAGLAIAALPNGPNTLMPETIFTADGGVLQVAFTEPDAIGEYFGGRWLAMPGSWDDQTCAQVAIGTAVEQFGLEELVDGRPRARVPAPRHGEAFDWTGGRGPRPTATTRQVATVEGNLNPDPSFEQRERFWEMAPLDMAAKWTETQVHSGEVALDLSCDEGGLALATTNGVGSRQLGLKPNSLYQVTYRAKCTSGASTVQVNFYSEPSIYDFLHAVTPIPADGEWHEVSVEVPTGEFPAIGSLPGVFAANRGIAPALRLWTIDSAQRTYVDDVAVRLLR